MGWAGNARFQMNRYPQKVMHQPSNRFFRIYPFILAAALLGFGAALSGYLATGAFMRYSGDDYCFSAVVAERGFWDTQVYAYLHPTTFAGNRFSSNLVIGISSVVGPGASAVLPGLILALWIGGMALALRELFRLSGRRISPLVQALAAAAVAFFVLYLTPNLGQSFYWRAANVTYLLPMTVNTYLAALVLNRINSANRLAASTAPVLVLAFFSGGFSETVTAMQIGLYVLACTGAGLASRRRAGWARRAIWLAGAALLGSLLALAVLALSPITYLRQLTLPPPPGILALVRMSLYNAYIFMRIALSQHLWVLVLCGSLFAALSYLYSSRGPYTPPALKSLAAGAAACLVISYLLVVCTIAPSAYAQSSYPDLRALIAPWWVLMIEIGILGWLVGQALFRWVGVGARGSAAVRFAAAISLLTFCALPLTASFQLYALLPRYQRWAAFWDARDALLRKAGQANVARVEVMQIDKVIQDVGELRPDPTFWYNVCAAQYYGVKQIVADLPGWDN